MTNNYYTVDLTCDNIDHVIHQTVEAKSFVEAIKLAIHKWYAMKPVVKAVRLEENPKAAYDDKLVPVILTGKLWTALTTYLLMSTNYRESERDAWNDLAKETNEDGTPTYKNAQSNADFWKELIEELDVIQKAVDERG